MIINEKQKKTWFISNEAEYKLRFVNDGDFIEIVKGKLTTNGNRYYYLYIDGEKVFKKENETIIKSFFSECGLEAVEKSNTKSGTVYQMITIKK